MLNFYMIKFVNRHLHLELCCIARELNGMFEIQIVFEMASYLFFLTSMCHYLYGMLIQKVHEEAPITAWIGYALWSFTFVSRLCIINYICETVSIKVKSYRFQ